MTRADSRREFVLRRVMSACGVVPLGVFVIAHLAAMAQALRGPEAFADALAQPGRWRLLAEALLIGVPLLVHAGIGLSLTRQSRPNLTRYPYAGNLAWLLQRMSGGVVLVFLLLHVWKTRIELLLGHGSSMDLPGTMVSELSSTGPFDFPFLAAFYLLAMAATSFHLANGVLGFAASFGLVRSERARARLRLACVLGGALVMLTSTATVVHLATGSALPWGTT